MPQDSRQLPQALQPHAQSRTRAPDPAPKDCILRIQYWIEGSSKTQTFCFNGTNFYSPDGQLTRKRNVYRLVYFALAPSSQASKRPLLVVDAHHPSTEADPAADRIRVNGQVFCFLKPDYPYLPVRTTVALRNGALQYRELTIGIDHKHGNGDDLLRLADHARPAPNIDLGIQRTNHVGQEALERATGLRIPVSSFTFDCGRKIETLLSFVRRSEYLNRNIASRDDQFYTLKFTLTEDPRDCPDLNRTIRGPVADHEIPRDARPPIWRVEQRPSSDMDSNPSADPAARWILHIYDLPGFVTAREWNTLFTERYQRSLRRVLGGRAVSFLPLLEDRPGGAWIATYIVTDRQPTAFDDLPPDSSFVQFKRTGDTAVQADAKILSEPVSLGMMRTSDGKPVALHVQFPSIQDLNGNAVSSRTLWSAGYDALEDLERLPGVVLRGDRPVTGEPAVLGSLVSNLSAGGLTMRVAAALSSDANAQFPVRIDTELIRVNAGANTTTPAIARGQEGSAAAPHPSGSRIYSVAAYRPVVRMGSLDLEFASEKEPAPAPARDWFILRPEAPDLVSAHVDAHFLISDLYPGGQDASVGEEFVPQQTNNIGDGDPCAATLLSPADPNDPAKRERDIEAGFRRKTPIVIDLTRLEAQRRAASLSDPKKSVFQLHVAEDVRPGENQTVRLEIISNRPAGAEAAPDACTGAGRDVVVLDRNPFLVAKVHYLPFDQVQRFNSSAIAQWSSDSATGASWQLQFNQQPFCLALPPQGVGEEMVKDPSLPPDRTATLAFRFSPAALLTLDPRAAQTRFAEAPWNLRRILGSPGQPFPGPLVKRLQYELLYGLSCDATNPVVRLAEIFARVGGIAARRDPEILWPATQAQSREYYLERKRWSELYRRYLARVAVLEPWNNLLPSPDDPSINLVEGLSCVIRAKSDMQNPITGAGALRGGATWGFESNNVYQTVLPPAKSSSASVSDLELSSLGGWGRQRAAFQNDLTKIYADVAMGRAYTYKLERLGRIGVFWNLAKHVIVYERSVGPSRQFYKAGREMYGWPVLRKVREYVEILEDVRTFPDDETLTSSAQRDAAKQARGPVASCTFAKGAQFNVLSGWGADVGLTGWKVPLWNPGANPACVYPKPKISLGLYSNVNDAPQIMPSEIARPEGVFFYTQTKAVGPGGALSGDVNADPHKWAPVRDVDYVDYPRPAARTGDFVGGDLRQLTPDDTADAPAYGPCTFHLVNAGIAANLVMDRNAPKAMSAVLESVTMVRSKVRDIAPPDPPVRAVQQVQDQAIAFYRQVLAAIPAELPADTQARDRIKNDIRQARDAAQAEYRGALTAAKAKVLEVRNQLTDRIKRLELEATARLHADVQAFAVKIIEDYAARAAVIAAQSPFAPPAAVLINSTQRAVAEKFALLESLPGAASTFAGNYIEAAIALQRAVTALPQIASATQAELIRGVETIRESYQALLYAGSRRPAEWLPDPTQQVLKFLDGALGNLEAALKALEQAIAASKSAQDLKNAVDAFQKTALYVNFLAVSDQAPAVIVQDLVRAAFAVSGTITYGEIDKRIHLAQRFSVQLAAQWNRFCQDRLDDLTQPDALARFQKSAAQLEALLTVKGQGVHALIDQLGQDAANQVEALAKLLAAEIDAVESTLDAAVGEIEKALNQELDQAAGALRAQRDRLAKQAGDYLNKTFRSLIPEGAGEAYQAASNTLALIRAFGDPPKTPQLDFDRGKLAYFFKETEGVVNMTPALARVNQAAALAGQGAAILDHLKPLGVSLPSLRLFDQLIPPNLRDFDISKILPNFAGLDLKHLFAGLKMPLGIASDAVKVTNGLDPQTRRAFVRSDIDFQTTEVATLFTIGPVCLQMPAARFEATTLIDAGLDGVVKRKVNGKITGDWRLGIGGQPLVRFKNTVLSFDDAGGIQFSVSPRNIELPGVLAFISDALAKLTSKDSGLSIGLLDDGFQSVLSLPVPDISAGAFGISNLKLGALFAVRFTGGKFVLNVGFNLARKEAPFALTIFILGGGGYLDARAIYRPDDGNLGCRIEVGITASASLAISLGPISGGVYVYLGITGMFETGGPGLTLGVLFLIRGEVNILGIVTAAVSLLLEATYQSSSGTLVGHGRLSISIKICWCFTLDINEEVTYTLAGGNPRHSAALPPRRDVLLASNGAGPSGPLSSAAAAATADRYRRAAEEYVGMFV